MQTAGGATLSEETYPQESATDRGSTRRPGLIVAYFLIAAVVIGLDQLTKALVVANLDPAESVRLLGGALYLSLTTNSGAAFSLFTGYTWALAIVAGAVVVFLIFLSTRIKSVPWAIALGLVLGGASGNLIDRLFQEPGFGRGHVIDFISVFQPDGGAFPIFNIADSSLVCGVVLIVLLEFTGRSLSAAKQETATDQGEASEPEAVPRPEQKQ